MRLTGDASSFRAMLATAKESVQATAKVVDSAVDRIQNMGASITQFSRSAVSAFGALGLKGSVEAAFDSFAQLERQTIRLNAAIEVNGGNVVATTKQYKDFADAVVSQTLMTRTGVMGLLQEAEALGKTGDAAVKMASIAIALGKGDEAMAKSKLHLAHMIDQGEISAVRRILRMRGEKDETKLLTELTKRLTAGQAIAIAEANTMFGAIQKLKRSFVDLNQEVGGFIAEAIKPVIEWLQQGVKWFKSLDAETRKTIVTVISVGLAVLAIGPTLGVVRSLLGLFSPIGVAAALAAAAVTIWVKSVGGLANAWEIVQETAQPILEGLVSLLEQALDVTLEFVDANKETIATVGVLVGVLAGAYGAYRIIVFTVGLVNGVLAFLHVKQILLITLWVAWKVVIYLVTATLWLYNASLIAAKAILWLVSVATSASSGATAAYYFVLLVAKGVIWLFNAALTVMNFLLGSAAFIAAVVTVGALAVAFAVAAGAVVFVVEMVTAVYEGLHQLFGILFGIPKLFAPIQHVASLLGEWKDLLVAVFQAATVDLALAWEILAASAELAISQLKDLWPPLWTVIKEGFVELWDYVSHYFEQKMVLAGMHASEALVKILYDIFGTEVMRDIFGVSLDEIVEQTKKTEDKVNDVLKRSARALTSQLALIMDKFKVEQGEVTTEAYQNIELLMEELDDLLAKDKGKPKDNNAAKWAADAGNAFKHAYKEIHKVNQILFGTAEASQRIEEWRDMITLGKSDKDVKNFQATLAGGGDAAQKLEDANDKLAMIVEFSRQTAAALGKAPPLIPAGFGGGGGL